MESNSVFFMFGRFSKAVNSEKKLFATKGANSLL